jgi:hypothetical protein
MIRAALRAIELIPSPAHVGVQIDANAVRPEGTDDSMASVIEGGLEDGLGVEDSRVDTHDALKEGSVVTLEGDVGNFLQSPGKAGSPSRYFQVR